MYSVFPTSYMRWTATRYLQLYKVNRKLTKEIKAKFYEKNIVVFKLLPLIRGPTTVGNHEFPLVNNNI